MSQIDIIGEKIVPIFIIVIMDGLHCFSTTMMHRGKLPSSFPRVV
jgi:hypothetical protein